MTLVRLLLVWVPLLGFAGESVDPCALGCVVAMVATLAVIAYATDPKRPH